MSLLRVRGHGRHIVAVVLSIATLAAATPPTGAVRDAARWSWPLQPDHSVVRGFEPPADPWGPGHRGVDIAGAPGQPVLAVAAGTVTFAGQVAGTGVVVVNHGRIRSTYQPVVAAAQRGDRVAAGEVLGTLSAVGSHCLPATCLHLGARRGDDYIDPLSLLGDREIRLLPLTDDPERAPAQRPPFVPEVPGVSRAPVDVELGARMGLSVGGT